MTQLGGFSISGTDADVPKMGILCEGRCTVSNATPSDVFQFGIYVAGAARIRDLTVTDNEGGILSTSKRSLRLENVTAISNSGFAISGGQGLVRGEGIVANNNGAGIFAYKLRASDVTANDNAGEGVVVFRWHGRFRLTRFIAMNNGSYGIRGGAGGRLIDSTVIGNDSNGDGIDIVTDERPDLINTTCGRSGHLNGPLLSWGVCAND